MSAHNPPLTLGDQALGRHQNERQLDHSSSPADSKRLEEILNRQNETGWSIENARIEEWVQKIRIVVTDEARSSLSRKIGKE